ARTHRGGRPVRSDRGWNVRGDPPSGGRRSRARRCHRPRRRLLQPRARALGSGMSQLVRAYGDTTGDGMVQLSFTLPLPAGPRAEAAAADFARKMGLDPALVVHAKAAGERHTFFVVYGRSSVMVDLDEIVVVEREFPLLNPKEINLAIRSRLGRRLVVVGATVGTDAHTVGLDAILNVKGFAGEKGLESYREIRVVNLGAQVAAEDLVGRAFDEGADAVLVSQVVTQRDAHLHHVREVAAALDAGW